MKLLVRQQLGDLVATVAHSTRMDGDLSPSIVASDLLAERRQRAVPGPWRSVSQIHSDRVIEVVGTAARDPRVVADALVTRTPGVVIAVHSGDCVPVGFVHEQGAVAVAHAGWQGLEAGVLESTVRQLRSTTSCGDPTRLTAIVGPHIRAARYEFGEADLDRLVGRFGPTARAVTSDGRPALDLTAAINAELGRLDVVVSAASPDCTAADDRQYWSHRARQEASRIALVAWLEPASLDGP